MPVGFAARGPLALPAADYEGPGDIITSGWVAWWGLRAFTAAQRGDACCRVMNDTSPNAEADILTDPVTGEIDVAQLIAHLNGDTGHFMRVYDQSGNSRDLYVYGGGGNLAPVALNAISGSLPGIVGGTLPALISTAYPQPLTVVAVAQSDGTANTELMSSPFGGGFSVGFNLGSSDTNIWHINPGGGGTTAPAADDAPHAMVAVLSGTSSILRIDGDTEITAGFSGTNGLPGGDPNGRFSFPASVNVEYVFEGGIINASLGETQRDDLSENMMDYYGITP